MFSKVLIANRGEIACRVAATCKRLGIASVAVYSDADREARHVAVCDEAVHIGAASVNESYLRIDAIIAVALQTGAQAIHPGYGFLSENQAFAQACAQHGIAFIGPPVGAIAAMGSKAAAKALMHEAGVPLVPGYHGADQEAALLQREADQMGYPVLLKASAGGGGKGMRVVERSADFAAALVSCQREARSSFGDDRVLIEKYLLRPRHVEIQVFADTHGNCVYLFERDCSVQRRHQKVLEEAPAPGLSQQRRTAMGEAAVAAARAVGYVGAGTVEFIVAAASDGGEGPFYFMEMNTRLQVEHPVTEMITGLDLVEWQLRVAAGGTLPLAQAELRVHGHALEARVYAENPARNFLPSTGTLHYLRTPAAVQFSCGDGAQPAAVRIDSGIREHDTISPYYDPMIAKLIVWGQDRAQALARMAQALREFEVVGLHTNLAFLERLVTSVPFSSADLDTGLIERHQDSLFAPFPALPIAAVALAAAALLAREAEQQHAAAAPADPYSPWQALRGWRVNGAYARSLSWLDAADQAEDKTALQASVISDGATTRLEYAGACVPFAWARGTQAHTLVVTLGEARESGRVFVQDDDFTVFYQGRATTLQWQDPLSHALGDEHGEGKLTAPMPGKVIAILAQPGSLVEKGAPLLVMEAMKMEHTISAPSAGTVEQILFAVGDQVQEGAQLLAFSPAALALQD
jgi:3-methylcrotonyl-CoA carboxylase alpha subunit